MSWGTVVVSAAVAIVLSACHPSNEEAQIPGAGDRAEAAVEALASDMSGRLRARAIQQAKPATPLADVLAEPEFRGDLHYPSLLGSIYATEDFKPALIDRLGEVSPLGQVMFDTLSACRRQGIDPETVQLGRLAERREELAVKVRELGAKTDSLPPLSPEQKAQLLAVLRKTSPGPQADDGRRALDALIDKSSGIGAFAEGYGELIAAMNAVVDLVPRLELLLADTYLRYANVMRFANLAQLSAHESVAQGDIGAIKAALAEHFAHLRRIARDGGAEADVTRTLSAEVDALQPHFQQYARLVEALATYRTMEAAGGWPTAMPKIRKPRPRDIVRWTRRTRNKPADTVRKVKARLAGEGYYSGPLDNTWTDEFTEALRAYRRLNQLWDKPWIDYELVEAMKIPVEYRIAQIKLALERWRNSPIGNDTFYIYVNVPSFFGEVWEGDELKLRFPVIVGNTKRYRDRKTGQWRFPNATPEFSAQIETVVFSPYWNVPSRIKRHELDKKLVDNPNWYEENGYEIVMSDNGQEMVRQKPGPGNALGKVKIIFPNKYDVYFHDTARKDLFRSPVRAYSHGCMRVQDPLKLAHLLLSRNQPEWTMRRVRGFGRLGRETWARVVDAPRVVITYSTVRVNDEGKAEFLADIYLRDSRAIKARWGLDVKSYE